MREIVSPLAGIRSPFGQRLRALVPANAIRDRAGNPILDRSGNYIEVRA